MKEILRKSFFKNSYLIVIAGWLYILSILFSATSSFRTSPATVKNKFERYLLAAENKYKQFAADTSTIASIINDSVVPTPALKYNQDEVGLFVYTQNVLGNPLLRYWSNNKVSVPESELKKPDGIHLIVQSHGEFEFLKRTINLNGRPVIVGGIIPIRWNYFSINEYLSTDYPALEKGDKDFSFVRQGGTIQIRNGEGKVLFGLVEKAKEKKRSPGPLAVFTLVIATCFLLAFFNMVAFDLAVKEGWMKGFLFLFSVVVFLRTLSYHFNFPFNFRKLELFDPSIYASNFWHPSLGDLLINMILLFWLVSFIKYTAINTFKNVKGYYGRTSLHVTILISLLLVLLSFGGASIIRSLIIDSNISFDVANFFKLTIYTVISFFVLCLIVLSFFNISHLLLLHLYKCFDLPVYVKFLAVAIAGLLLLTLDVKSEALESNMMVLLWLSVYLLIMEFRKGDMFIPLMRSSFFLIWLIFFASSVSALIIYQSGQVEMDERKAYAEKLALQADPTAESLLSIGVANFNNLFLTANFHRFSEEFDNKAMKDSLIKENFSAFLNKYDTRIYTFDKEQRPLFNEDRYSFELIYNLIINQSKKTSIPDVYYFENAFDRFTYFVFKEVRGGAGDLLGYFFVAANPKKYKSEAVYPELFKSIRDISSDYDLTGAYAIYNKGQIMINFGDYNFVSELRKEDYPKQDHFIRNNNGFSELWYNAGNNKIVVVVRTTSILYQAVTLFAYLFGAFLFIVVLFHAAQFLIRSRFRWSKVVDNLRLNIRNQIQTTIIFISVFSFLVIAAATIIFYINRFNKSNRERLVKSINTMANEIKAQIANHAMFDDGIKIYDQGPRSQLQQNITEIAEVHSIDVNFFDLSGNLILSTQPYIYSKQILSGMMDRNAYHRLHYNKEIQVMQEEQVGKFSFLSIYVPIKNEDGTPYAYLNVPYINSQRELNQEISNFLVTLINLNAFIFVFAGIIAFLLTKRITRSFTMIGEKMKDINLGRANEEIEWHANDEIGELVNEYNKMVKKLEASAQALAKSEREGAWREMARQVAHEIKNPLTPMKLSIQYLQRSIQDKNPDIQVLSQKVATTLVEQIDQLAKIASDFSQFANIGHAKIEVFDVSDVLASLVDLYNTNEKVNIKWNRPSGPSKIEADRNQVHRLFTNLIQNAIEASSGNEIAEIEINQVNNGNKLSIDIIDYGIGIPAEKHDKIFTPNFTTKSSGTGLGLAICKGIVEKANGRIWFETKQGKGTTFFVLLPLVGLPA